MKGVYMRVPDFFNRHTHPDYAPFGEHTTWELLTSLYGLKQAAYKYYQTFSNVILSFTDSQGNKYRRSQADPCVFTKGQLGTDSYVTFSIHIDDAFLACAHPNLRDEVCSIFDKAKFKYTCEPMVKVLGMGVNYVRHNNREGVNEYVEISHDTYVTDSFNELKENFTHQSPRTLPLPVEWSKQKEPQPSNNTFDKERYKLFRRVLGKVSH